MKLNDRFYFCDGRIFGSIRKLASDILEHEMSKTRKWSGIGDDCHGILAGNADAVRRLWEDLDNHWEDNAAVEYLAELEALLKTEARASEGLSGFRKASGTFTGVNISGGNADDIAQ